MYQYLIYNQKVTSDFMINCASETKFLGQADVIVTIGEVPTWIKEEISQGVMDNLTEEQMWFYIPEKLIFFITNGNHILIDLLSKDVSMQDLCSYMTGSGFALLLVQKGLIPIHGSTINIYEKTVIITGRSGSGKSSTVFELMNQGGLFLSDDVSPLSVVENKIIALPAFPQQKICHDIIERYHLDEKSLIYIDEFRDKYARKVNINQYVSEPRQLDYIIELIPYPEQTVLLQEVRGVAKLQMLTNNLYRGLIYEKMGITIKRMDDMIQIASEIKMYQLFRPVDEQSFDEVNRVLNELLQ